MQSVIHLKQLKLNEINFERVKLRFVLYFESLQLGITLYTVLLNFF